MELLYKNRSESDQNFIKKVCEDILIQPYVEKEKSEDFFFLFVDGRSDLSINKLEHYTMFHSCHVFSQKSYPIYCFVANTENFLDNNKELIDKYNINIIKINPLNSLQEYSDFMMNEVFFKLPSHLIRCITIQADGFLLKAGVEEWIIKNNIDLIGAKWGHSTLLDVLYNNQYIPMAFPLTNIGNLGFSYRNASYCRLVKERFRKYTFKQHWDAPGHLPEDAYFCYLLYGSEICKKPTEEQANQFSLDPLTYSAYSKKETFGFHYFKYE